MKRRSSKQPKPPANLPQPADSEEKAILAARTRVRDRPPRLQIAFGDLADANSISPNHADHGGWLERLQDAFGSRGTSFPLVALNRLIAASKLRDGTVDATRLNGFVAFVDGLNPSNELEAAIACQLAVTHNLTMDLLHRAKGAEQITQFDSAGNMAAKLMRVFVMQVEALAKLRRGGEQTVRVEHVHVHPGGQAIVGHVTSGGRGHQEKERQPHAPEAGNQDNQHATRPISFAPGQTLPGCHPEGEVVPVAGGKGKGAL